MADEEHLAQLRKGVKTWNAWRQEQLRTNPAEAYLFEAHLGGADLAGADLAGADLKGADLKGANLRKADLAGAHLGGAHLEEADLGGADLKGADLAGADLAGADLKGADLKGANLRKADLAGANLGGAHLEEANLSLANLKGAHLEEANLKGANLEGADLEGADLYEANLKGAHLRAYLAGARLGGADLGGADLKGAYLERAHLGGANLEGADLERADFLGATLNNAKLLGANLKEANLSLANLRGANLRKADLKGANLHETIFANVDLSTTKGLEACIHRGPSVIDHRTLQRSGCLPLAFLRGCGLPDRLIDYLPSLLEEAIQYYSCFISYSSKDEAFAKRLHADLQNNGVRCWFAPHDLPIGAKTRDAIDEAIRLRDKVLLILSKRAIASDWVEAEVTKAFAEESRRKQTVLFPVRIDDTVLKTEEAWASTLRDQRTIGDFRKWKDHDAYQQAFERVLRDLKTVPG